MRFPYPQRTLLVGAVVVLSFNYSSRGQDSSAQDAGQVANLSENQSARAQEAALADSPSAHPPAARAAEPSVRFNFAGEEWLGVLQWFAVDAHGGSVACENGDPGGAVFVIKLGLAD